MRATRETAEDGLGRNGPPLTWPGGPNLALPATTAQFYREDALRAPNPTRPGPNLAPNPARSVTVFCAVTAVTGQIVARLGAGRVGLGAGSASSL